MYGVWETFSCVGFLRKDILHLFTISKIPRSFVRIFHAYKKYFNLSTNREFATIPDHVWCSTGGVVTGSSSLAGYKSNSKKFCTETNHLKSLRRSNLKRLIFAHLNINSIRNKFELLAKDPASNVDLLMISETKIDNSFPKGQFLIKGFCEPFRIDRNIFGREILFYVREDIPVKLLSVEPLPAECLFVEINLRKKMVSSLLIQPSQR